MGEKARLRAEVIEAQEQRDAAIARAERAEAAYAAIEATVAAQRERRGVLPAVSGRFSDWLDDLHRAVGL